MNEKEFDKKYKSIARDIPVYDLIKEIPKDEEEDWIMVDGELFSRKWN